MLMRWESKLKKMRRNVGILFEKSNTIFALPLTELGGVGVKSFLQADFANNLSRSAALA